MKQGFTLTELLIVVFIVGMLAAIALPQYSKSVERSRTTEALSNGRILADSMNRAVLLDPHALPNNKNRLDVKIGGGTWNQDGNVYSTKDFRYDISNGSYLLIERNAGGNILYRMYLYNRYNPADAGKAECKYSNDLGKFVCDLLGEQGYLVSAYSAS